MNKIFPELKRIIPLLVIIGLVIFVVKDLSQVVIQFYALSMVCVSLLVLHFVRKALFPYIDLSAFSEKAKESSVGSAIVYASVIFFIIALIYISKV